MNMDTNTIFHPYTVGRVESRGKRNVTEIIIDILNAARGGRGPTQTMYKTNLSWVALHQYADWMIERGLVEFRSVKTNELMAFADATKNTRGELTTTEKGIDLFNKYIRMVHELMGGQTNCFTLAQVPYVIHVIGE